MQIAFLTLFLGLVTGPQAVAVDPGAGVAAVELVLDGRGVARLEHAPWSATVDFGPALLPHRLEARGLAADGSEVARTDQWVNLPRPQAEVDIVLEGSGAARAPRGSPGTASPARPRPSSSSASTACRWRSMRGHRRPSRSREPARRTCCPPGCASRTAPRRAKTSC